MAYTPDCTVVICSLKIVYLFFSLNCLNILTLKNYIYFIVNIFIQFEKEAKLFSLPPKWA